MHQAPKQIRSCRGCGTLIAQDHAGDLFCSACQSSRSSYDPRHDPRFAEALLALLKEHPGQPVHVHRELGIDQCGLLAWRCVQVHIRRFRRQGHVIVGRHDGTYEYRGQFEPHRSGRARGRRHRAG